MIVGVIFDIGVWYEAKSLVIFNKKEDNLKMESIDQPS